MTAMSPSILKRLASKISRQTDPTVSLYEVERFYGGEDFYLIHKTGGGMFSILSAVLCLIDQAEKLGLSPIIDFQNFATTYSDGEVSGVSNAWEYYFEPISKVDISVLRETARLLVSPNDYYPMGYDYNITRISNMHDIYTRWIKLKPDLSSEIEFLSCELLTNRSVLGVHFRGQEMRTTSGHWFPPTKPQVIKVIDDLLSRSVYSHLFVVSEEASYIDFIKSRYGSRVLVTQCYRTYSRNAYKEYPREKHMYKLGKEVIINTFLLSRCAGLVSCTSNVAEFARFLNGGNYLDDIQINNGPNSSIRVFAKYLWFIKALLPPNFGGFSMDLHSSTFVKIKNKSDPS